MKNRLICPALLALAAALAFLACSDNEIKEMDMDYYNGTLAESAADELSAFIDKIKKCQAGEYSEELCAEYGISPSAQSSSSEEPPPQGGSSSSAGGGDGNDDSSSSAGGGGNNNNSSSSTGGGGNNNNNNSSSSAGGGGNNNNSSSSTGGGNPPSGGEGGIVCTPASKLMIPGGGWNGGNPQTNAVAPGCYEIDCDNVNAPFSCLI